MLLIEFSRTTTIVAMLRDHYEMVEHMIGRLVDSW